jgi:SOS-response transcriptional repressor LexA
MNMTKTFGQFAKERLSRLGKSQKAFADVLGVSPAYISQIFSGKKNPPDLGKSRHREQLRLWCEFLNSPEEDVLGFVRYELHKVPLRPIPKYKRLRKLLLSSLINTDPSFVDEIKSLELHPAENAAVKSLAQIYLIMQEVPLEGSAFGTVRFVEFCSRARTNKEFVEGELVDFFSLHPFTWDWDEELNEARISSESSVITEAIIRLTRVFGELPNLGRTGTIPVVGHVSAGEGFEYTDGGYLVGEGFEHVELPPGIDPKLARKLYCVRVRGDSLKEFFGDGTLLFIKPESWEEVKDGDLVIFKRREDNKAFVKKVEFSGDSLILKSMNPMYKNIVVSKWDLGLLERVSAIVL